jgi:carbonic anhydrase
MAQVIHGPRTAAQALERLRAGNERFVRGEARFPTVQKAVLAALARAQHPYVTLLGCSDSRVPPEILFDAGFGELFVIRVAGNVLMPAVAGSLQYAALHLKTPLFVILGHEGCGAVKAALDSRFHGAREHSRIQMLLKTMLPGLESIDAALPAEARLRAAVEANVRWTMRQIFETPEARARQAEGVVKLVGAVAEIATGRVRFLEGTATTATKSTARTAPSARG